MKKIVIAITLAAVSLACFAKDLKLADGKVIKDITVYGHSPNGVDVAYKSDGMDIVRHVLFSEMAESERKAYGYNAEKAKAYQREISEQIQISRERHAKMVKAQKQRSEAEHMLAAQIEAKACRVVLKVSRAEPDGVIAYADAQNATLTSGHFGKVFVRGLIGSNGCEMVRTIYPTGGYAYGYPCYVTNLDLAIGYAATQGNQDM